MYLAKTLVRMQSLEIRLYARLQRGRQPHEALESPLPSRLPNRRGKDEE